MIKNEKGMKMKESKKLKRERERLTAGEVIFKRDYFSVAALSGH